jgi:hypothetical protein
MVETRLVALIVIVGLCITGWFVLSDTDFGRSAETSERNRQVTVMVAPPYQQSRAAIADEETTGSLPESPAMTPIAPMSPIGQGATLGLDPTSMAPLDVGAIHVAKRPIPVLAGPSSSAPTLYGFPAGRPFQVVGRVGGFAQIRDLRSGAWGWIEEAALAPPPRMSVASTNPKSPPASSTAAPKGQSQAGQSQAIAETPSPDASEPPQTRRRRGLFGLGFRRNGSGGDNNNKSGFAGFIEGAFGNRQ